MDIYGRITEPDSPTDRFNAGCLTLSRGGVVLLAVFVPNGSGTLNIN
jgi:hypothetical protein